MIRKGEAGRGPRWLDRRPNWLLEEAGLGRIYNPCLLGSVLLLSASTAYLGVRDGQLEHEAGARVPGRPRPQARPRARPPRRALHRAARARLPPARGLQGRDPDRGARGLL